MKSPAGNSKIQFTNNLSAGSTKQACLTASVGRQTNSKSKKSNCFPGIQRLYEDAKIKGIYFCRPDREPMKI